MERCVALLLLVCLSADVSAESKDAPPVAETRLGSYRGHYRRTLNGRQVVAFQGVRYATPPLNHLRFKEAEMVGRHEGLYEATEDGDDCLQENRDYNKYDDDSAPPARYVGQEDCLFLNIYTPSLKPDKRYPVMVYIHGGSYIIGTSASNYHGPELLLDRDVLLVTLNYRLGVFGFLSVDDEIVPGNMGLKDQSLAIRWVRENIDSFGGDPESITLVGHSAGAACVHFHMFSPLSKGVIRRAVSQSGSGDSAWSLVPTSEARQFSSELIDNLGCTPDHSLLACLQQHTVHTIMDSTAAILRRRPLRAGPLGPVLEREGEEGRFMSGEDLDQDSLIPWMTGVTRDEGLLMFKELYEQMGDKDLTDFNANYETYLPELLGFYRHPRALQLSPLIKEAYFPDQHISGKNIQQFVQMLSDGIMFHGQVVSASRHRGQTYFYHITHAGQNSLATGLPLSGVSHADELFYLFPFSKRPGQVKWNQQDASMRRVMLQLWTDFIIHGDPTPGEAEVKWNEWQNDNAYVNISADGITPDHNFFSARINLWINVFSHSLPSRNNLKDEL